jgi:Ni/Co efflux regulator RcnB
MLKTLQSYFLAVAFLFSSALSLANEKPADDAQMHEKHDEMMQSDHKADHEAEHKAEHKNKKNKKHKKHSDKKAENAVEYPSEDKKAE